MKIVKRGEIYMANLPEGEGSEQTGKHPVVIIQNDVGNKFSPTTIVAAITSAPKPYLPTHMKYQLFKPSTITCEQIFTVSKSRLIEKIAELTDDEVDELETRLKISLGIIPPTQWDRFLKTKAV